jgi:hypothetical protein
MAAATIKQVKDFFGETNTSKFVAEWKALSPESQEQLKNGIGDGSLDY